MERSRRQQQPLSDYRISRAGIKNRVWNLVGLAFTPWSGKMSQRKRRTCCRRCGRGQPIIARRESGMIEGEKASLPPMAQTVPAKKLDGDSFTFHFHAHNT
jgi:hypothetical protein